VIKIGNRVSLFYNIGKEGTVVDLKPIKINEYFTGGSGTNSWRIIVDWDDGSQTTEKISDVMRID
jgi:hypothetical protein